MANPLDEIRDQAAAAALSVAQELGIQVSFHNPGDAAWQILWAFPTGSARGLGSDEESLSLNIPRQGSFPPASGIGTGAVIRCCGFNYTIESANPDIGTHIEAATFDLECHRAGVCGAGECDIGEVPA